ncbi:hypothetical protein PAPHI01_1937 [Pancytospora philotis]|nr:hypothetical protein PAPHI01_1937 [Pancytospora philotis]
MLAAIFWQLVRCHAGADGKVADPAAITTTDYTEFGALKKPKLNALEKRVLDQLWTSGICSTSPEIPSGKIDARMTLPSTAEKTCCLTYSVLDDTSRRDQPHRLLDRLFDSFGSSGHILLEKLFCIGCPAPAAGYVSDAHKQLAELIQASSDLLEKIAAEVGTRVRYERTINLAQYAKENKVPDNTTDYILLVRNRYILNKNDFIAELSDLFDYWFNDYERFSKNFTTISECISIIWHYRILPNWRQPEFRDKLARHIIDKEEPRYLDLLSSFLHKQYVKQVVTAYFEAYDFDLFKPQFVLNYIKYAQESGGDTYGVISRTWRRYLKDVPTFLRKKTAFKDELFTQLPQWFLHKIFVHLKGLPANDPSRGVNICAFVRRLDCDLFLQIVSKCKGVEEQNALLDFMLDCLDASGVKEYASYVNSGTYGNTIPAGCMDVASQLRCAVNALMRERRGAAVDGPQLSIKKDSILHAGSANNQLLSIGEAVFPIKQ